jgi:uncharacterized protein YkwD
MTVDALSIIRQPATVSKRAVRVDPPTPGPNSADVTTVVGLINTVRTRAGLRPVAWNDQVTAAATAHSIDQAAMNRMTHTGSDGSDAGDRLTRAGFVWRAWGENVAAGYTSVQAVFDGWMASSAHKAQILGDFLYIGMAAVASSTGTVYWTLDFAR